MCRVRLVTPVCAVALALSFSESAVADSDATVVAKIDAYIRQGWSDNEITPSERATDSEFARRASLDIIGHIPSYEMLTKFLKDDSTDKRSRFVDELLDHPNYIRNWTTIWANTLIGRDNRANRGARDPLERWLRDAFARNLPYDKFVFELISAEGTSEQNGAVNFLASHLNNGAVPATAVTSRIFLGLQVQCTQCHNHPFNDWKQQQFWSMNAFFQGTRRIGRGAGTQLTDRPGPGIVHFEKRSGIRQAAFRMFVDGTRVGQSDSEKPRTELGKLVTDPSKPYMSIAQVNRTWGHFFGYGFTRPIDDMGPHNPPSHPELLDYLAQEFQSAAFDPKRLVRWITASEAYNLTSRFCEGNTADDPSVGNSPLFGHIYLKQFTAEQLYDSLIIATEAHKSNRSEEAAENQRRTWLRQFVQTFGTDENDESTTFNGTIPQALVMMNGQLMQSALNGGQGSFLRRVLEAPQGKLPTASNGKSRRKRGVSSSRRRSPAQIIETLFLLALSRKPTASELNGFNRIYNQRSSRDPIVGLQDVFWAILNSNEFIINH